MACATDHLCLATEKSHQNTCTKMTQMHYSREFPKAVVCQITLHCPHIPPAYQNYPSFLAKYIKISQCNLGGNTL